MAGKRKPELTRISLEGIDTFVDEESVELVCEKASIKVGLDTSFATMRLKDKERRVLSKIRILSHSIVSWTNRHYFIFNVDRYLEKNKMYLTEIFYHNSFLGLKLEGKLYEEKQK